MLNKRLAQLRKDSKLKQDELAKILGVARTTYAMYEQGKRNPDFDTLQRIADFFNVTADYLLGRSDSQNYSNIPSAEEYNSLKEINRLLEKYEIDDMSFFDIEKWKSMSAEQIRELESYFQYLVEKSKGMDKK